MYIYIFECLCACVCVVAALGVFRPMPSLNFHLKVTDGVAINGFVLNAC